MGIDLAKALFVLHARDLTASELAVLGYMCITALDKPNAKGQPANVYWKGWEPLALTLGYPELTDAAKTKIKRAVKGCREKGLIEPLVAHAQAGTRQSYRIVFGGFRGSESDPQWGSTDDPQEGVRIRPKRGSESDPPRTHTGEGVDLEQDVTTPVPTEVQPARDPKKQQGWMRGFRLVGHEYDPAEDGRGCWTCGLGEGNKKAHPPLRVLRGA